MKYLDTAANIIDIAFMVVFIFIGIWLFVIALKAYKQLKYKNYILEKIYSKLSELSHKHPIDEPLDNSHWDIDENFSHNFDNVKNFDKSDKK